MSTGYSTGLSRIAYGWGVIVLLPHVIKLVSLGSAGYKWDNTIGRANMAQDAKTMGISPAALQRAKNADAAHQNGNESLPLFAAAVLAAISTGVDATAVDFGTKLYLGARVAYLALFMLAGKNDLLAFVRTISWGTSVYASISLLLQASKMLAAKGL